MDNKFIPYSIALMKMNCLSKYDIVNNLRNNVDNIRIDIDKNVKVFYNV